jgi:hypothetical protein
MVGIADRSQDDVEMDDGQSKNLTGKRLVVGSADLNFKRDAMEI